MAKPFFDPNIDPNLMNGEFKKVAVIEVPGYGTGNLVIDRARPFTIEASWEIDGLLSHLWIAALGGNWSVTAYAESIGPGPEVIVKQDSVPVSSATVVGTKYTWSHNLVVPANTLPEENPGNPAGPSGVYRLVVTAFLNSTLPTPGYDIMGFADGPSIKVESPL